MLHRLVSCFVYVHLNSVISLGCYYINFICFIYHFISIFISGILHCKNVYLMIIIFLCCVYVSIEKSSFEMVNSNQYWSVVPLETKIFAQPLQNTFYIQRFWMFSNVVDYYAESHVQCRVFIVHLRNPAEVKQTRA